MKVTFVDILKFSMNNKVILLKENLILVSLRFDSNISLQNVRLLVGKLVNLN